MTELCRVFVELVVLVAVPQIPIQTEVMKEEISLENTMHFDHPEVGLRYERLQQDSCQICMVKGSKGIPNIVQQGAYDVFFITPIFFRCASGGLRAVSEAIYGETAEIVLQQRLGAR